MYGLSIQHLLVLLVIVTLIFGTKKLRCKLEVGCIRD